jgi:ribonuclease HI
MAKKRFYVIWRGKETGVFDSWDECEKHIRGFAGAEYKSFPTRELAEKAYQGNSTNYLGKDFNKAEISEEKRKLIGEPVSESLSVDAACSGNPGVMEYRGVDTKSGIELFRGGPYENATVNIGEFLALVHGLAYLKERNSNVPIYSDSRTAIKWVNSREIKTNLQKDDKNSRLFEVVDRAIKWLETNSYSNRIIKWETAVWGEIPADFGRK